MATTPAAPLPVARVTRSRRPIRGAWLVMVAIVVVLAAMPFLGGAGVTSTLVNVFILLTMASMWNLLAGYAGLVSVGQQAFVGAGAYTVLVMAKIGLDPFLAIPFAALGGALLALPISWLVLRLRGGYFAIATWVVADVCQLVVSRFPEVGGGTGAVLPGMTGKDPATLANLTYWAGLAVAVVTLAIVYLTLRGRLGLALTAIRDDETGAGSVGANVMRTKRIVFVVAALGTALAGAILIISQLNVQASAAFSVQWSAEMIFVSLIGGIGSIEGPIIGTLVYFTLQQLLADQGAWYLILLGLIAIATALWAPRGIWGLISARVNVRLFPVGYWLWTDHSPPAAGAPAASTDSEDGHGHSD